jgi:hypothetical protein
MTTEDLVELHGEFLHLCDVRGGPVPELVVACRGCGTRLEAALLSPCVGGRQDKRAILMLGCPSCAATGQVRLVRDPFGGNQPPEPVNPPGEMEVRSGGPGYLSVACHSCDGYGANVFLHHHSVTDRELVLGCASLRCGHPFELRVPRTSDFRVEEHHHGRRTPQQDRRHA